MPETAFYGPRASTHLIGVTPTSPAIEEVSENISEKAAIGKSEAATSSDTEASIQTVPEHTFNR